MQEALGRLLGAANEVLLALSVEVGLGVLGEMLAEEVEQIVGPKGRWNRPRTAVRHGHEDGEVTLGGRRVAVKRPRVRTADGESEVLLQTMSISPTVTSSAGWRSSRSSPTPRPASTAGCRNRLGKPLSRGNGRRRSHRSRPSINRLCRGTEGQWGGQVPYSYG